MRKTVSGFTSTFLLSWKGDIVLGVLNKRRDPILHDTHSKSIIEWLIVFTFLPLSLPSSSCDKDAKVKTFWNDFFEIRGSLSNRAQSASILSLFHAGAENQPLHNEAEKWEKRYKRSQPAHLNTNLMHLLSRSSAFCSAGCSLIVKSFKVYQRKRISDSLPSLHGSRTELFLFLVLS